MRKAQAWALRLAVVSLLALVGLGGAQAAGPNDLVYHGGSTLHSPTVYVVLWLPPGRHLEPSGDDGVIETRLGQTIRDLGGTHYLGVTTQYSRSDDVITNQVGFGGLWVDTTPYPHAGIAADPLQVADYGDAVRRAMATNGWQPGLNALYLVYTASPTEVCGLATIPGGGRDPTHHYVPQDCTFPESEVDPCFGHSFLVQDGQPAAFAVVPSPAAAVCVASPGVQDPNHDLPLDSALIAAAQMIPAMITDPLGTAWYTGDVEAGELACSTPETSTDLHLASGVVPVFRLWSNAASGCATGYPSLPTRVSVAAAVARAHARQTVTVKTAPAAQVDLSISYANGRSAERTGETDAAGGYRYSWTVPKIRGKVTLAASVQTGDGGEGTARATFRIR